MTKTIELTIYEGLPELSEFLVEFKYKVLEPHRLLALEEALKDTPSHWWATHKNSITGWSQCRILITAHFRDPEVYHAGMYDGRNGPGDHLSEC